MSPGSSAASPRRQILTLCYMNDDGFGPLGPATPCGVQLGPATGPLLKLGVMGCCTDGEGGWVDPSGSSRTVPSLRKNFSKVRGDPSRLFTILVSFHHDTGRPIAVLR